MLCIPISLAAGGFWENFFGSLGFQDDRLSYLTEGNVNDDDFSSTGFRWDFLLYSATAVYAGWYFIIKKGFEDKIYFWLFNTYVFANAFWILVIRANFSNRFAYLSWFMMALVIIYPLLKKEMIKPKLNVSYNFLSNENAPDNTVLSTNNYKWGANISFPILLRNSVNNYKMSKINSQNNNFELINKINLVFGQEVLKFKQLN